MIDFLWVIGRGSKLDDAELGYSMRSVCKHVKGFRDLIVVGDRPYTDPGVAYEFHELKENPEGHPADNVRNKISYATERCGLSDDFVLMNDDFFFCADVLAYDLWIPYNRGLIADHIDELADNPGRYRDSLEKTYATLRAEDHPTRDYEVHLPIMLNKLAWRKCFQSLPLCSGGLWRSLYANVRNEKTLPKLDCKFDSPVSEAEILRRIKGRTSFSCGDGGLLYEGDLRRYLRREYPKFGPDNAF